MRGLFLCLCVLTGVITGLWWTGVPPSALSLSNITEGLFVPGQSSAAKEPADHSSLASDMLQTVSPTPTALPVPANEITSDIEAVAATPEFAPYSYHDGIMRVAPAVVSVYASGPEPDSGADTAQNSQGSGVIVAANGTVLTNLHLVENFSAISVVLNDGRTYPATLIGSDAETDLAVVRIDARMLPFMELDEAEPLKVGDIVLAIGNPFGVGQTVTQGIVSATRRRIANGSVWQNFIQIDAAINPGNSGGALINPRGQLVGVNTAVLRGDSGAIGIGFAIPADLLAQVVPQIIENGSVSRGWLGLGVEDINMFPALTSLTPRGAVITAVQEGGPAFLTGVQAMDVVVQLGEQPISSATQLLLAVSALPPGATVKLVLLRSHDPQSLNMEGVELPLSEMIYKVKLGERPTLLKPAPR